MRTILFVHVLILSMSLSSGNPRPVKVEALQHPARLQLAENSFTSNDLTISLHAASGATILYKAENGIEVPAPDNKDEKIPHLVLNRNGVATPNFERTLHVSIGNLQVPPSGLYVGLDIETQHADPDLGRKNGDRIPVWQEKRFLPYAPDSQEPGSLDFKIVFQRTFEYQGRTILTPTDYYGCKITVWDHQGKMLRVVKQRYAFLMENQWQTPLPDVLEASPGAAPERLVVYFYDMIPFQSDSRDAETRIPRQDIEAYIQTELVPAMVDAFVVQSNVWNLPWYEEWTNPRSDEDPKILSVALGERGTWFHGVSPSLGHAMISIRVDGSFGSYESITDGILSVFQHELFHNQQRNISLHFGSQGNILGKDYAWEVFSEGTAVLASFVGQPRVQFVPTARNRSYLQRANSYIGSGGLFSGALNSRYKEVPYQTALYWRFLYEKCGGLKNGLEDPATGMQVIRAILETLYKGEIVDINASTDVSGTLPRVVDAALQATPSCPFHTHQESLIQFARAIYLLRLEDGRCTAIDHSSRCGLYDPSRLYTSPEAVKVSVVDGSTRINGSIRSSYGIDLVEFNLDPSMQGKSIKIIFRATSTSQDEFHVELQGIRTDPGESSRAVASPQAGRLDGQTAAGHLILEIPAVDIDAYNGLGIIITRLDPGEESGSEGNYLIQMTGG